MQRIYHFILAGLMLSCLLSCNKEIVDFFEAIQNYGYRSTIPLGPKKVPIDERLLGAYVFDELPVTISKKDKYTYKITFLTVSLYREDAVIEAHPTQIGTSMYLNLNMGDYYCIIRANLSMNQKLEIDLLKEAFREHIPEKDLKAWLTKNGDETVYEYTVNDYNYTLDIYHSFGFEKITVDEALRIQAYRLNMEKKNLFEYCDTYLRYEDLVKRYPDDEFIPLAIESLYKKCTTIEAFEKFMSYFPTSEWNERAKQAIADIKEKERQAMLLENDRKAFLQVKLSNSLETWESFKNACQTESYRDSASAQIAHLASMVSRDDVEWKWSTGQTEQAYDLLCYKVEYLNDTNEAAWIIDLFTLYTLKNPTKARIEETRSYFDKLVKLKLKSDDFLQVFIANGFLLWMSSELDNCVRTFETKINQTFESDGKTVKEHIVANFEYFVSQGITFPEQKKTWKVIKKLKTAPY